MLRIMNRHVRSATALGLLAALLAVAVGCTAHPISPSAAAATRTATRPVTLVPTTRSLDALPAPVEDTVRIVLRRDAPALVARMRFKREKCVHVQQVGSPPPCATQEAEGTTLVEAFAIGVCDGGPARRDVAARFVRSFGETAVTLFAVYHPPFTPQSDRRFELLFVRSDASADRSGMWLDTAADGTVVGAFRTCGTVQEWASNIKDFVIPPP